MDALISNIENYGKDLAIPIFMAIVILILGVWIFYFFRINRTGPEKSINSFATYTFFVLGLIIFVIGIVATFRTVHFYVFASETTGSIEKLYYSKSGGKITGGSIRKHHAYKRKRYALVKYETENGIIESEIRINLPTPFRMGENVTVLYLSGSPSRSVIRGEVVIEEVFVFPIVFTIVGGLFFGIGLGSWAKQLENGLAKKNIESFVFYLCLSVIAIGLISIPVLALYKYVPIYYNKFYKFMGKEETIYEPLVADGVEVKSPDYDDPKEACKPIMSIRNLSNTLASGGDIIKMHGSWGVFTSDKVPQLLGRNLVRRLKVIEWTPETITVELPDWLKDGTYRTGVNCYMDTTHRVTRPSGFLEIQID